MSHLAELLELLHAADTRWATLAATVRTTMDHDVLMDAWEDADRGGGVSMVMFGEVGPESGDVVDPGIPERRVWFEQPNRYRSETSGPLSWTVVSDGERTRHRMPDGIHESDSGDGGEDILFRPARFLAAFVPEGVRATTAIGRRAFLARGPTRRTDRRMHDEATEIELVVDRELGIVLRATWIYEGRTLRTDEVLELVVNEPLDPALFRLEPAPGETLRRERDELDFDIATTIEGAAERASFTVWVPERLPPLPEDTPPWDRWEAPWVNYVPAREAPPVVVETVSIQFMAGQSGFSLHETAATQPIPEGPGETVERDGRVIHLAPEPRRTIEPQIATVDLGSTRVQLSSQHLDAEALAEIAASLVPAGEPPPLVAG